MPRRRRIDAPGMFHHVMNRGLARRTVFETAADAHYFLALLACEARAGRIRVVSYALLTTHFHLLLMSRTGELSSVMQRVQNLYVRYFNRRTRRDGPLFRSRFLSKPVRSEQYMTNLIRYIDQNAPQARLAWSASAYPYGSAFHYVRARRPKWLWCEWVDARLDHPSQNDRARAYERRFGRRITSEEVAVIESRLSAAVDEDDHWDSLVDAAPARVRKWMVRKARLADGTKPGLPYVAPLRVLAVIAKHREGTQLRRRVAGQRKRDAWPVLTCGLLRDLAGLTFSAVARHVACSPATAAVRYGQHRSLLTHDEIYREQCALIASECLRSH